MPKDPPKRRSCAAMNVHRRLLNVDPLYGQARTEIEDRALAVERGRRRVERTGLAQIQTVVHVVYKQPEQNISDAQVKSQIEVLNADFRKRNADVSKVPKPFQKHVADTQIEFVLATRDIFGDPASGITRTQTDVELFGQDEGVKSSLTGGADAWPSRRYLNIWACELGDSLLGYAQFPGGPAATDGVVILHTAFGTNGTATAPFNRGRTTSHEVGHWLNLFHIWGDDGTGCSGSDLVADTPNQASENTGVPTFPHISCNNGPHGDMFMNYMDYTDDRGMFMFSKGQSKRMNATLDGARSLLLEPMPQFPGPLKRSKERNAQVAKVQRRLRDRFGNPTLKADGIFGSQTEKIVKAFQQNRRRPPWKLRVDGVVGKRTWAALWA